MLPAMVNKRINYLQPTALGPVTLLEQIHLRRKLSRIWNFTTHLYLDDLLSIPE